MSVYSYVDGEGQPLRSCPECGHDLTKEDDGILLTLSVDGHVFNVSSCLCLGFLQDTEDNAVSNDYHSATCCGGCGEMLFDMAGVEEVVVEDD